MVEIIELVPLFIYFFLALGISFLCSLLEAVFLSVTHPYMEMMAREGQKAGTLLKELKVGTDKSLAAILSLNTIAHTIGAAGVGAEVHKLYGEGWVTAASAVLTLLILVFSEIIPKSLGAANWKRLAPMAARTIRLLILITYPLVWLLVRISRVFQPKAYQDELSREEMIAAAEMGGEQGSLEADETRVIRNLLRLDKIPAEDVMTPSTVMMAFKKGQTVGEVVKNNEPIRFSRIPIIGEDINDITGIILRRELLRALSDGRREERVESLLLPLKTAQAKDSVGNVLDRFIKEREHIFLVVDEYGCTEGLVTLEDAVETLLGVEIVDEDDSVVDMRKHARELWEKRNPGKSEKTPEK